MNLSALVYEGIKSILSILPIIIPLSAIIFLLIPSRKLLVLFMFFIGFQAIFIDVGVMVTIPRIFILFSILTVLIFLPKELSLAARTYPGKSLLIFLILFLAASAILNIPNFPVKAITTSYGPISDAWFRDRATKQASQILMFMLKAAIPLIVLAIARTRKDIGILLKAIFSGTTVLCLYGVYQYFAFFFHLPAIFIFRGASNPTGAVGLFGTATGNLFRISSLAGEPKDLAGILLPFLVLLGLFVWDDLKKGRRSIFIRVVEFLLFVLHLMVFILTFSTAGWLGAAFAIIGIIAFSIEWRPNLNIFVALVVVSVVALLAFVFVPSVNLVIKERLINRLNIEYLTKNTDYGVPQLMHMYKTRPQTIFYGASLGGAVFYEQYNEQPESIVYYLFDYGVLGILVLLVFLFGAIREIIKNAKQNHAINDRLFHFLLFSLVGGVVGNIVFPKIDSMLGLWVLLGLTAVAARMGKIDESTTPSSRLS